jgi:hypothetical protein
MTINTDYLNEHPEFLQMIQDVIEFEETKMQEIHYKRGWTWHDVKIETRPLNKMVTEIRVIEVVHTTNSRIGYRISVDRDVLKAYCLKKVALLEELDKAAAERVVIPAAHEQQKLEERKSLPEKKPTMSMFDDIYGLTAKKQMIIDTYRSERTHVLLNGPPGCAKSMILEDLAKLPNYYFTTGSSASKSGLMKMLFQLMPPGVCVDELDKMEKEDFPALLTFMVSGRLTETKAGTTGKIREAHLDSRVFASSNYIDRIPAEVQSRFIIINIQKYTDFEFQQIAIKMGEKYKVDRSNVMYMVQKLKAGMPDADLRDVEQLFKIGATNMTDINRKVPVFIEAQKPLPLSPEELAAQAQEEQIAQLRQQRIQRNNMALIYPQRRQRRY